MTNEEALERLREFNVINLLLGRQDIEALDVAKDTLRKEIPKQVELVGDGYADGQIVYDWGKCPNCGWEFEDGDKDWEEPYCCHCGQKLKWFER